jgi:predicted secreted protein
LTKALGYAATEEAALRARRRVWTFFMMENCMVLEGKNVAFERESEPNQRFEERMKVASTALQ